MNDRIEINPRVLLGKAVIRGTRIPVELVVRRLGEGLRQDEILEAYPRLTRDDILAALRYAADTMAREVVVLPGSGIDNQDALRRDGEIESGEVAPIPHEEFVRRVQASRRAR